MSLAALPSGNVVLILGAPRSGTTWLAKIFDSHPDVLYRHEPDTVLRETRLPGMCSAADLDRFGAMAGDYVRALLDVTTLKTVGSLPLFAKRYRGAFARRAHAGMVYGLRGLEQAGAPGLARQIAIPDLIDAARLPSLRLVLKSVSARGRARLYANALPGCRVIFIVRDPWGQVSSMMKGEASGKFEHPVPVSELLASEQACRYGLTAARFQALTAVERFAWNWAILNEKVIDDLNGHPAVKVLRYQDLCAEPMAEARALFDFAALPWHRQTEDFVARSTTATGPDRYYQVFKDTPAALNRWRSEMPRDDQRRILDVVRATSLAPLCPSIEQ